MGKSGPSPSKPYQGPQFGLQEQLASAGTILPYVAQNPQLMGMVRGYGMPGTSFGGMDPGGSRPSGAAVFAANRNAGGASDGWVSPYQGYVDPAQGVSPQGTSYPSGISGTLARAGDIYRQYQAQNRLVDAFKPQGFQQAGQQIQGQMMPNTTIGGTQFAARNPFQFSATPSINVPDIYRPQMDMARRGIEEQYGQTQEQLLSDLNSRGLLTTGATTKATMDLMRDRDRNLSDMSSQFALQQGQMGYQEAAARRTMEQQRQMAQAEELFRQQGAGDEQARFLAQSTMAQQGQAFQQGLQGRQQATAEEQLANLMRRQPYEDLMRLYQGQIGQIGGSPGNPGAMGAIGSIAGAALPLLFCLPKGTMIKRADQTETPIEDIRVGDMVMGGKVTAAVSYQRAPGHKFGLHRLASGKTIVMTPGHPALDPIESIEPIDHVSRTTHDIQTTSGWYIAGDVALKSTIGMEAPYGAVGRV